MPRKRIKPGPPRHYLFEWREFRDLSQEKLAEAADLSTASISQIENGTQGYSQASLESLAEALGTDPTSLLIRHPNDPEGIWAVWDRVPIPVRAHVITIVQTFAVAAVAEPIAEPIAEPTRPTKRGRKSSAFARKAG